MKRTSLPLQVAAFLWVMVPGLSARAQEQERAMPVVPYGEPVVDETAPAEFAATPETEKPAPAAAPAAGETAVIPVDAPADTAAVPAAPTDPNATQLDSIQVTGSRIRRSDYETSQPVLAINRADIDRTGLTTIGELLQDLPGTGSALNTTINNGGTGATEIDLRNLGSSRTLVLVNGHRWVNGLRSLATSAVDLNTIPIAAIERIEVLRDGASAVYGSDAMAGVVNVILKRDFEGLQGAMQAGVYGEGDGLTQEHSLSWGHSLNLDGRFGGTSSAFGNFSFGDQQDIFAGDRKISEIPKPGTGLTRGSGFLPQGHYLFIPNVQNGLLLGTERCPGLGGDLVQGAFDDPAGTVGAPLQPGQLPRLPITVPPEAAGIPGVQLCNMLYDRGSSALPPYNDYRAFVDGVDQYNFQPDNYLATPLRTYNFFTAFNHRFNDGLNLAVEAMYSKRESEQQAAPQPICVGNLCPIVGGTIPGQPVSYNQATYVPANQPFNPFNQDIGRADPADPTNQALGLVGQGAILRRMSDVGDRLQTQDTPTTFLHFALSDDYDPEFKPGFVAPLLWEVGFSRGESKQTEVLLNQIDMSHLMLALGPVEQCSGDCVPVDFFTGRHSLTKAMRDYLTFDARNRTRQVQDDFYGTASTSISGVPLIAGPIGIAFGFEFRKDSYAFNPDRHARDNTTGGLPQQPTKGVIKAKELFMEFSVPVLADLPFAKELELSLAGRYSDYNTFGSSNNGKLGLRWKPIDDLLVRSSFSSSFRAPDVGNLFLGLASSYPGLADPCVAGDGSPRVQGSDTDINCDADGVPDDVAQNYAQILSPYGGNEDLKPETSHSLTAGLVYSPEAVAGLDVNLDFFQIHLNDFITAPGGDFLLERCYQVAPENRSYCDAISRNPTTQELQSVLNTFQNIARVETAGFDLGVAYTVADTLIPADAGMFRVATEATLTTQYDQITTNGAGEPERDKLVGHYDGTTAYPRWKINPSIQWVRGALSASWNTYIVWHQQENCFDGLTPSLVELGLCSDPDHVDKDGNPDPRNKIGTAARHDVQVGYKLEEHRFDVTFGVQNVFDRDPPITYSSTSTPFNPSDYWVPGQLFYLRARKDF